MQPTAKEIKEYTGSDLTDEQIMAIYSLAVKDVNDLQAIGANTRLATAESEIDAIQQQLANLVPLTDAELQAMLDDVY